MAAVYGKRWGPRGVHSESAHTCYVTESRAEGAAEASCAIRDAVGLNTIRDKRYTFYTSAFYLLVKVQR